MVYLVNSFAPNMIPIGRHIIEFNFLKPKNAARKLLRLMAKKEVLNCIGHTLSNKRVLSDLIKHEPEIEEQWIAGRRFTVKLSPKTDSCIVASYRGKRLKEETKELPDNAEIVYWRVCFRHNRTLAMEE